ncbi:hypothetical protein MMC13_002988 [Lambiella insularis]|nr:hypothetical protein [Lambiella insularis]
MAANHAHVHVIIHKDFAAYELDVLQKLQGAEGCVWAQGVSANDVSKSEYVTITHDYPLAAAKAFRNLSKPFKFVYVSGEGTTATPGMLTPYFGVIKGRAEASLLQLHKDNPDFMPFSVRPAAVDPAAHTEIHPFIPKLSMPKHAIGGVVIPALRVVWKNGVSPTRDLGRALVNLAMGNGQRLEGDGIEGEGRTIRNSAFRRLEGI